MDRIAELRPSSGGNPQNRFHVFSFGSVLLCGSAFVCHAARETNATAVELRRVERGGDRRDTLRNFDVR